MSINLDDLTLDATQSIDIKADIGDVFRSVLHRLGEERLGAHHVAVVALLAQDQLAAVAGLLHGFLERLGAPERRHGVGSGSFAP